MPSAHGRSKRCSLTDLKKRMSNVNLREVGKDVNPYFWQQQCRRDIFLPVSPHHCLFDPLTGCKAKQSSCCLVRESSLLLSCWQLLPHPPLLLSQRRTLVAIIINPSSCILCCLKSRHKHRAAKQPKQQLQLDLE